MREDQHKFMMQVGRPPARLTAEQASWMLNCNPHDITILLAARLLKPLGNPAPNGIKFFATADILALVEDRGWLVKATNAVNQYWIKKNQRRKSRSPHESENGHLLSVAAA